MLFAAHSAANCSGKKSCFSAAIWSVIHASRAGLYRQKCWCESIFMKLVASARRVLRSAAQIEKAAVDRIVRSGDERGFVRAQKQRQRGHFVRFAHAADVLGRGKQS